MLPEPGSAIVCLRFGEHTYIIRYLLEDDSVLEACYRCYRWWRDLDLPIDYAESQTLCDTVLFSYHFRTGRKLTRTDVTLYFMEREVDGTQE